MSQQVKTINSEALEAAYRSLTPSQDGFTEDLMASNTIIPVLDLTADAAGTSTPVYLQNALAFGSQTAFDIANTTTDIANSPGFYQAVGVATCISPSSATHVAEFIISDGLSNKIVWSIELGVASSSTYIAEQFNITFFLRAGDSFSGKTDSAKSFLRGSIRQVADVNGNPVLPSGFTPQ